jgi:hypothetical protein
MRRLMPPLTTMDADDDGAALEAVIGHLNATRALQPLNAWEALALAKREPGARALLTDVPAPDRNTLPLAGHPIAAPGDAGRAWGYRGRLRPA